MANVSRADLRSSYPLHRAPEVARGYRPPAETVVPVASVVVGLVGWLVFAIACAVTFAPVTRCVLALLR